MIKALYAFLLSVISGTFYRMGGASGYNTKYRDLGVPVIACVFVFLLGIKTWFLFLYFLLLFASLTTYFKKKDQDAKWWNWVLCGLAYGLSTLSVALPCKMFPGFFYYTIFTTTFIPIWSCSISNAKWEEFGRGALIILGIPLLIIK